MSSVWYIVVVIALRLHSSPDHFDIVWRTSLQTTQKHLRDTNGCLPSVFFQARELDDNTHARLSHVRRPT